MSDSDAVQSDANLLNNSSHLAAVKRSRSLSDIAGINKGHLALILIYSYTSTITLICGITRSVFVNRNKQLSPTPQSWELN